MKKLVWYEKGTKAKEAYLKGIKCVYEVFGREEQKGFIEALFSKLTHS